MAKSKQSPEYYALRGERAQRNATRERGAANQSADMEGGRPTRPSHLSKAAKKEWNKLVKRLLERGTLTPADASVLELHCELYARHLACLQEIEKHGAFEETMDGRVESAASKLATKLAAQLRQTLVQLGLTPAAREKAKRVAAPRAKDVYEPGSVGWLLQQQAEERAAREAEAEPEPDAQEQEMTTLLDDASAALAEFEDSL